jgi:hypothetical protein
VPATDRVAARHAQEQQLCCVDLDGFFVGEDCFEYQRGLFESPFAEAGLEYIFSCPSEAIGLHKLEVFGVAFSLDGQRLPPPALTTRHAWDAGSGHELTRVTHDNYVDGVAL